MNGYYEPLYPPADTLGQLRNAPYSQRPPMYMPSATQNGSDIIWVQGEVAARAYPIAPGKKLQLMDSEDTVFYIKVADYSGVPMPLKKYRYYEEDITQQPPQSQTLNNKYVTHDELNEILKKFNSEQHLKEENSNA